jgi:spermidine synthase
LVISAIAPSSQRLAGATSLLYALNVLGATVGAALAGFVLPMSLGVNNAVYLAATINMLVGLGALALSVSQTSAAAATSAAPSAVDVVAPAREAPRWIALVAIVSGFGTLALEVLYVRTLSFNTAGSVYNFGLMLVIFLLSLALGSAIVARLGDSWNLWRLLAVTQAAAMVGILLAPILFDLGMTLTTVGDGETYSSLLARFALVSLFTLGPPVILAGMVLPATWKLTARDAAEMSRYVGHLVASNTLAAVAGSLVTGFFLLPWLGLGGSLLLVAALYGALAIAGFWRGYRGIGRWIGCAVCLAIPAGWFASGAWRIDAVPLAKGEKLVRYRDGAGASVAVIEHANGHRTLKMNNNYTLGSSASAARELRQGRLPLVLHPRPRNVAFIGVATGMTVSAVKDFPVEHAVAIELVAEVGDALADFKTWNRSVFDDPRVELVVEDGRNYLLGTDEKFDVIVSDLFVPWHAGSGDLYSVEHFRTARSRLAEGGIFAQWLPGYQLTVDEIRTIAASLLEVFPAVTLWRNDFELDRPLVCLVCYKDAARLDAQALADASGRLAKTSGAADSFLSSPLGVCMLYVAGDATVRSWARGAPLNTDNHPYIEFTTPGSFHRHRQRDVAPIDRLLTGFRPRKWEYPESGRRAPPMDVALRAGDLMHDAQTARQANNFQQEYRCLMELIPIGADVPAVAEITIRVASRYRTRNMVSRGDELLLALSQQPQAPVVALVALADLRRTDGKMQDAIDLLSRAIERVPEATGIRHALLDLLKQSRQYGLIESHLQHILETRPDEPYLRLDLAQAFDRQGKTKEAQEQIERFRRLRLGEDRRKVWKYLRGLELGKYVDEAPAGEQASEPAEDEAAGAKPPSGQE